MGCGELAELFLSLCFKSSSGPVFLRRHSKTTKTEKKWTGETGTWQHTANQKVLIDTRGFEMSRGLQFPPGISVTHQPFLDYLRMLIHEGTQKATTPS